MDDPASRKGEGFSLSPGERARQLQQALADRLKADGLLDDAAIESAFRTVPRHLFLPDLPPEKVYIDEAIGTKFLLDGRAISSSSQPSIMAIMLAQLDLSPGQRVLEIGAGTGYNAALLSHIVGEDGSVTTVDIDQDTALAAREHLAAAGNSHVRVVCADGFAGLAEGAPYDRVLLTVGTADPSPAWWEQLAPGGRLVLPLELIGPSTMVSVGFDWKDDHLESVSIRPCGFMMLRGMGGSDEPPAAVRQGDIALARFDAGAADIDAITSELAKGALDMPSGVAATRLCLERDVRFWLGRKGWKCFVLRRLGGQAVSQLLERGVCQRADDDAMETWLGVARKAILCTLALNGERNSRDGASEIWVSYYGRAREFAAEIVSHLRAWRRMGYPSVESMQIRAYPAGARDVPSAQIEIEKPNVRLLLDWPEE